MQNQLPRVFLAACLCAVASAQGPGTDGQAPPAPRPSRDPLLGGVGLEPSASSRVAELVPQDTDYGLYSMFQQAHGDFMQKRERYNPSVELRGRLLPNYAIKNEPGHFDLLQYGADLEIPALVSSDGYLLFGGYYEGRQYQTKDMSLGDETLNAAGAKFGFGAFLDDNVFLEMVVAPGVWSDMDGGLHHKDFDYPGKALFTWRTTEDFFFKLGARYNQVFEEAPWLPYLGFAWNISENFRLDVLAPESIELSWWPSATFGIPLGAEITGAQYHVRTGAAAGNERDDVQVQEIIVYGGLIIRPSDHFSIIGKAGLTVAGDYDLTSGAAGFNRVEGSLERGFFAEVSVGFDF